MLEYDELSYIYAYKQKYIPQFVCIIYLEATYISNKLSSVQREKI